MVFGKRKFLTSRRFLLAGFVFFGVVAAVVSAVEGAGDAKNPHLWKSRVTSVAVFKNGLGFFLREGDVGLREGWCLSKEIPPAAFGTLATYSLKTDQTVDVVGAGPGEVVAFDGHDAGADAETKRARLTASVGLRVALDYRQKGLTRSAAGTLVSVGPDFVVLDSANNSFAVPLEGITQMKMLDLPLRVHVAGDDGKPIGKTALGMAYLRKGITWIPEYTLKVL
ncbi:MAG: hypothetical protein QF662_04465, partial [Phycisphaerae bacterium]|nr:hypothetical protein [Phycisphaerae bacterium]